MKRIESACLEQTLRFAPEEEFFTFKADLDKKHTKYKIVDMRSESDGSMLVKLKRQYSNYECGNYLK